MKKQLTAILTTILTVSLTGTAFAGQWEWIDKDGDGTAECYYMENGTPLTNTTTPDGYQVNADGAWIVNGTVQTQGTSASNNTGSASVNGVNHSEGYDPAHPLKNVIDTWNLRLTPEANFTNYSYICENDNVHAMLTGQMEYYNERIDNGRYDVEKLKSEEKELYDWFCNWLNGIDFEHMTEMERAREIKKVLAEGYYEVTPEGRDMICNVLIDKKGKCSDYAMTAMSLAKALGLRAAVFGVDGDHAGYYIQVDGVAYAGSNTNLILAYPSYEQNVMWTN